LNFFSLFKRKLIYNFKKKINLDFDNINSDSLDKLFNHYGSDKANIFKVNDKTGHGYSKFYEKKLEKFKDKQINILEIGSFSGASAAAFIKYFPNSKVFCFDINISNFKYQSEKIHVFGIDINNEKKIKKTLKYIFENYKFKEFDLIIDDGSHYLSDILIGLKYFFKLVKNDGLYVIEDFKHPNYYEYNNNINHIFLDELLNNLKVKQTFLSNIFNEIDQKYLIESVKEIENFKGNLKDSDISFILKN
tara:strand:- start:100 stop:843 length:744 start_codon:yes stop_codon:yes gene_type:complete